MSATAQDYARLRNVVFGLSLLAWLVLLRPVPATTGAARAGGPQTVSWCGTTMPLLVPHAGAGPGGAVGGPQPGPTPALPWAWMGAWALMLVAMMLPTLVQPLYHIRLSSFSRRRMRASALFVAGYGAVWLAAGGGLWVLARAARSLEAPGLPARGSRGARGPGLAGIAAQAALPEPLPPPPAAGGLWGPGRLGCPAHGADPRRLVHGLVLGGHAAAPAAQ